MKHPPIVEVVWDDHSWARELSKARLVRRHTVGFLVADTKKVLKVASTVDRHSVDEVTTIGKTMVVKVRHLR